MSITATGDGPQITATGTMPAITVTVTTGSGGGVTVHDSLTGKDAADQHPISAVTGLQAALDAAGESDLIVIFQHFTNLDITSPHPFGAFLPEGSLVELVGQTTDAENGTYVAPASAGSNPLVLADDQILDASNAGRQVSVLTALQGSYVYGPFEWIVSTDSSNNYRFAPPSGMTLFVLKELDLDGGALGTVDFSGAVSAGGLVLVVNASGGDDGLWRFVADGSAMVRSRIEAGAGTTVRTMIDGTEWVRTPHSGWVEQYDAEAGIAAEMAAHIADTDLSDGAPHPAVAISYTGLGIIDAAGNVKEGLDQTEGVFDRYTVVSAYAVTNVDLSTLVVESEVVTQPELSDGATPIRESDVWLFAQTDPAENGPYIVSNDGDTYPGSWVKYTHPTRFYDPAGNFSEVRCNAPGTAAHGVRFLCFDDDRTKSRRAGTSTLATPSGAETWFRLGPVSADLTANPGGGTPAAAFTTATGVGRYSMGLPPNQTSAASYTTLTGTATAGLIYIPPGEAIDRLAVQVTTAAAGATLRLALYEIDPADGMPGDLIVQTDALDCSTTGLKEDTVSAVGVGWCYASVQANGTACTTRSTTNASNMDPVWNLTSTSSNPTGFYATRADAALPADGTTLTWLGTGIRLHGVMYRRGS